MLRHVSVVAVALLLIATFGSIGNTAFEHNAYALAALSTGIGALANPLWRHRTRRRVTWRNVFHGGWLFGVTLPLVGTMLDGSSAGFIGAAMGAGIALGGILAYVLGRVYWFAYDRTRVCPNCAERVLAKARVCRYCHRELEASEPQAAAVV